MTSNIFRPAFHHFSWLDLFIERTLTVTKGGRIKERFKTQPCVDILFLLGIIRWKNDNKDIFFPKEIYSCFIMLNILNLKVYRQKNRFKQQKYTLSSDSVYHVGYFKSFHSLLSWTEKNNLMHVWSIQFCHLSLKLTEKIIDRCVLSIHRAIWRLT